MKKSLNAGFVSNENPMSGNQSGSDQAPDGNNNREVHNVSKKSRLNKPHFL